MEPGEYVGDFIIEKRIGESDLSVVYLANHKDHGAQAVVKRLCQPLALSEPLVNDFIQGIRILQQLRHPHLAAVYDCIDHDDRYCIVEEYLPGGSLADILARRGRVSEEHALRWCRDALRAIDCAHQSGIVHCDLRPANIRLNQKGEVEVTDFGMARLIGSASQIRSRPTPVYMSPEQIHTPDRVDLLTDVYSMGVVLYELLTGRVPFDSEREAEVRRAIVQDPPVPPRQINPGIAPEIERIVLKALQKRPENRFPGCGDFALHIERNLATGTAGAVVKTRRKAIRIPLGWIRDALQKFTLRRGESAPAPSPGPPQSSAPAESSGPPAAPGPPPPPPPQTQSGPAAAEPQPEPVRLGASAPEAARPGDHFVAQFAAYVRAQEEEVRKAFVALSRRSEPKLGLKTCRWKLNTPVKVMLTGEHLTVDPSMDEFVWEGDHNLLSFEVSVDAGAPAGTTVLKYHVYIGEVRVAMLPLEIEIGAQPASIKPKEVTAEPARTAFASYASEDRDRVLDRIAEAKLSAGLEVFMDCISLRAGSDWERCLEQEIRDRDLFLLFWSSHAKGSKWVTWEWQTALRQKGLQAIRLRPLQPVREAEPPEELKRLHFDDPLMVMHEYYRMHPPGGSD